MHIYGVLFWSPYGRLEDNIQFYLSDMAFLFTMWDQLLGHLLKVFNYLFVLMHLTGCANDECDMIFDMTFILLIAAVVYSVSSLSQLIYYLKTHNEPREIDLLIQKYLQSSQENAPPAYIIEGNFFNHYGYFSSIQNRIRSENSLDYLM